MGFGLDLSCYNTAHAPNGHGTRHGHQKRAGNFENRQVQTLTYIQLLHKLHTQNQRQPLVVGDMLHKGREI